MQPPTPASGPQSTVAPNRMEKETMQTKPNLERRHFQRIADVIAELPDDQREQVAAHFARRLTADNAGFKEGRFLEACGCDPAERRIQDHAQ